MNAKIKETTPDTPLSELTVGDLMELIGWAITQHKAAQDGDVEGFAFVGSKPVLPALNPSWGVFQSRYWALTSSSSGGE